LVTAGALTAAIDAAGAAGTSTVIGAEVSTGGETAGLAASASIVRLSPDAEADGSGAA
jgi:hypothetical protein